MHVGTSHRVDPLASAISSQRFTSNCSQTDAPSAGWSTRKIASVLSTTMARCCIFRVSLLYAKAVTGMDRVYCYYGGFHPNTDVGATVKDLLSQDVRYLIPTHCTPWPMVNLLWQENQKAEKPFLLTKNHLAPVGNVYTFSSRYQDP